MSRDEDALPDVERIGLTNLVVHGYELVNRERIWLVVERGLPTLEGQVRTFLEELG